MKKMTIVVVALLLVFMVACKKSDSEVCRNLVNMGTADSISLLGEWEFVSFAYSPDGNKIENRSTIQQGYISVNDSGSVLFYHTNVTSYGYTLSPPNSITMNLLGSTYINSPQEEVNISNALKNTVCYVVKGDTLLIHYAEQNKKNLFVLNKK